MRGNPPKRPRKWRDGEPVSAAKLEELRAGVDSQLEGFEPRQIAQPLAAVAPLFQAQITAVFADYFQTVEYRKYPGGTVVLGTVPINVAKAWLLRRTPFDGQTRDGVSYVYSDDQTRTATAGSDVRTEHMTPRYVIGDIVYASRNTTNGTAVEVAGVILGALEISPARMWAADPPP